MRPSSAEAQEPSARFKWLASSRLKWVPPEFAGQPLVTADFWVEVP